jgi:hypothetical protein
VHRILLQIVLLLLANTALGQVTFGPITLGKPLPTLPDCKDKSASKNSCLDRTDFLSVSNIPYEGKSMIVELLPNCAKSNPQCPVGDIYTSIDANIFSDVLAHLKKKFGLPAYERRLVQNRFGAKWPTD